ncbi:MFS transporter [Chloroflexota bacterium]
MAHFGHHVVGAMLRPLMPMIRTDLDLSYTQAGVVIATFAVTSGVSQLPAGWLADRLGPRLIVAIGISGVAIAGLLIGLSQSYTSLIVFLILAAILGGGYHPASANAVSALVPPERRGRALGLHLIGGNSSFWATPLLAAPIAIAWGWRSSYITLTIPTIVLGIVLYFLIGRQVQYQANRPQTVEAEDPTAPARIRWRQLLPFLIMSVTTGTVIQSVIAYLSLYAVDHFGVAEATAAMLVSIAPGAGLFAAPIGGYLSDRLGGVPVLVVTGLLTVPLIYLLGVVPNVPTLAAVMVVVGIVNVARMPTSEAYIVEHTPKRRRSTILGLYFFAGMEISGLLTPVIGNLIDRFGFYRSFTITSVTLAAVVGVCSMFLWRNRASAHNSRSY